jgi:hypothetical protein
MFRGGWKKITFDFLTICSLSKMGKLKSGQNLKKIYSGIKFCSEMGLNTYSRFVHVLPALEHHSPYLQ